MGDVATESMLHLEHSSSEKYQILGNFFTSVNGSPGGAPVVKSPKNSVMGGGEDPAQHLGRDGSEVRDEGH